MSACEAADIAKPNKKWFSFPMNPEKETWILIILMEVTSGTCCHSRGDLLGHANGDSVRFSQKSYSIMKFNLKLIKV